MDRAPDFESVGCAFESRRGHLKQAEGVRLVQASLNAHGDNRGRLCVNGPLDRDHFRCSQEP